MLPFLNIYIQLMRLSLVLIFVTRSDIYIVLSFDIWDNLDDIDVSFLYQCVNYLQNCLVFIT